MLQPSKSLIFHLAIFLIRLILISLVFLDCEKSEELFSMDMNDRFLSRPAQLRAMIRHLKNEIDESYKLPPQTMSLVKVKTTNLLISNPTRVYILHEI